ncbi:hypothetical protein GYH73_001505 [Bacillus megaterium]|nr:hypothetical protein [Priestia megaterium]
MMYLWDETDKNLERIRNKIDIDLKNDLLNYLEELNNDVESIEKVPWGDSLKRDLKNKIVKARTDIQERLNKISQWFIVSHNKDNSDYDINLLIDTFVELAKTLYPSHNHINIKKM